MGFERHLFYESRVVHSDLSSGCPSFVRDAEVDEVVEPYCLLVDLVFKNGSNQDVNDLGYLPGILLCSYVHYRCR
jgi:hypothetical protein